MTYLVRVTFRSGAVIKGTSKGHPVFEELGSNGRMLTLRLVTKEWKDSRHITTEEWDTVMNLDDVIMVQCRKVDE